MFKRLYTRMLFTNLIVVFAALLVLGTLVATVFSRQYVENRESDMRKEAGEINNIIAEKYFFKDNRRAALSELQVIARQHNGSIWVIDRQGGFLWVTDPEQSGDWGGKDTAGNLDEYVGVILDGYEVRINGFFNQAFNEPVMTIGRPLVVNQNVEGAIFFHTKVGDIEQQLRTILSNVTIGMALAVLLSLLLVPLTSRRFTRPLVEMNRIVKSFAKGDFSQRLKIKSDDELGEVARSVNTMADDLQMLEDMRKSFVANVSHELRSPLTSMRGFIEAAMDADAQERAEYLGIALSETKRMTVLVNDLLDLARIESGAIPLNKEDFDINELIRRILITFEGKIDEKNLEVDVEFEEDQSWVYADPDRITQVIRNLIDNAIKFTPQRGKLFLLTYESRGKIYTVVKDTGVGISDEDLPHVWDRFYKADKAHSSSSVGTGLGLSIVQRILEEHNSTIEVASREGEGTSFSFGLEFSQKKRGRKPVGR